MGGKLSSRDWISATLAKAGHRSEENEDAIVSAPDRCRFAIADGATEGWESGAWAAHLARAYIRRPPSPADFSKWLAATRDAWRPRATSGEAAWYAAEKQEQGSFATLVGLELRAVPGDDDSWGWKAVAVGDSCFVHIRDERIEASFPLTSRAEFGDRPPLVPSAATQRCPEPVWLAGRAMPDDLLVLASDAAAASLLEPMSFTAALLAVRESLSTGDSTPLLDWLRTIQATQNDDVSIAALRIPTAREVA